MCRLYAFIATEPSKVECSLVRAQNALLLQSRRDRQGASHPDGWGIAYYTNTQPILERQSTAAFENIFFSKTAERIYARTVIAHIRNKTVGPASLQNVHPFSLGRWVFAHNGTITAFEKIKAFMEAETDEDLLQSRRGDTDSEQAFLWILSRLRSGGVAPDAELDQTRTIASVLRDCIRNLEKWCAELTRTEDSQLNFVLSNGRSVVASRWRHPLYWKRLDGRGACEVCSACHCESCSQQPQLGHTGLYNAVVIASEPLTSEVWEQVPDSYILAVDNALQSSLLRI